MGQHTVPQRYLRNFEDPRSPGCVWLHPKGAKKARLVPIKGAAQTKRFYTDRDEARLARDVEAPSNAAIRKLTRFEEIDLADRMQLAKYIGTMIKRVPAQRRRTEKLIPGVLDDTMREVRELALAVCPEESVSEVVDGLDAIDNEYRGLASSEFLRRFHEPIAGKALTEAIFDMTWRVFPRPRVC